MLNKYIEENKNDEIQNSFNIKILDSILDDDDENFIQIVSQINNDDMNFNQRFKITNYRMPNILSFEPTYASLCCFFGSEKCLNSLITLFPDGIKSKHFNKKDLKGRQPIHFACINGNLNILRLFYQEEFDFNEIDYKGQKPSHYAAMSSTSDALKYLWMKGIDILKQKDDEGMTPFHVACKYDNIEIVKFLCEKIAQEGDLKFETKLNMNYYNSRISTPLHIACTNGCVEIVKYILKNKEMKRNQMKSLNNISKRPIDCAIEKGNLECVKLLVFAGKHNLIGYNRRHIPIIDASYYGHVDIVSFLLKQKNIRIDAIDLENMNALRAAIRSNHLDVIKVLIENGIGNKLDKELIVNAFIDSFQKNDLEIVKYLDEKLDIPYDQMGSRFMNVAISYENKNLVNFLLSKKCTFDDVNSYDNFRRKWTPFMTFLKEKGLDFNFKENPYSIPLIVKSIQQGSLNSIKSLMDHGIKLNEDIISKYDCIYHACKRGNIELFNFLISYKPEINNIKQCISSLISKYAQCMKSKKQSKKTMNDCIKIADALIKEYEFDVNNDSIICEAVNELAIEFLELFANYSVDFDKIQYDYSIMITKEFIPVFNFLESHGCTFKKSNLQYSCYYNYIIGKRSIYLNSPIYQNVNQSFTHNYDVNTLLFLMKYATNEDLIYSNSSKGNIIDVLIYFKCFDSILDVYKRLNRIIYPLNNPTQLKELIDESKNIELIDALENMEEEEINEKIIEYKNSHY